MSHDAILNYRQNPPAQCCLQFTGQRLHLGRSRRGLSASVWIISTTGISISSGRSGNRCARLGGFTLCPDYHQNTRGCCDSTSVACADQWYGHWRACGAGHHQLPRQATPPWLIAIGDVMKSNWTTFLIACMLLNWSKSLPYWFRTGNAELTNPQD
jgi:hypothetical protein